MALDPLPAECTDKAEPADYLAIIDNKVQEVHSDVALKKDTCGIIKLSQEDDGSSLVYMPNKIKKKSLKDLLLEDTDDDDSTVSDKKDDTTKNTGYSSTSPAYSPAHTVCTHSTKGTHFSSGRTKTPSINSDGTLKSYF